MTVNDGTARTNDVSLGSDGNDSSGEFDMKFAALNPKRFPHKTAAHSQFRAIQRILLSSETERS
jgi:hypothetical protein